MCEVTNEKANNVDNFLEAGKSSIPKWIKNSAENLISAESWDDLSQYEDEDLLVTDKKNKINLEDSGIKRDSSDEENIAISSSKSDCSSEDSALNKSSFPLFKDIYESENSINRNENVNQTVGIIYDNVTYDDVLDGLCKYGKILLEENSFCVPEIDFQEQISYYNEKIGQIFKIDDSIISVSLEQKCNRFITANEKTDIPEYKIVKNLNSTHILIKKDNVEKAFQYEIIQRNGKRVYYVMKKNEKSSLEKEILCNLKHPNIVEFFDSYRNCAVTYTITEYLPCGDLISLIRFKEKNNKIFTDRQMILYSAQILIALDYLHSLEHVYLNLLPQNICIDIQGYIKLTDLRSSKHFNENIAFDDVSDYQEKITKALNRLNKKKIENPLAIHFGYSKIKEYKYLYDIYALATLLELFESNQVNPSIKILVNQCYNLKKPTVKELMNGEFFNKVDFFQLLSRNYDMNKEFELNYEDLYNFINEDINYEY